MNRTFRNLTILAAGIVAVLAVSPVHAVKGNDNPGNPGNNGVGGPPIGNPGNGGAGGAGGNALQGQAQGQLQGQAQGQAQAAIGVGVGIAGAAAGAVSGSATSGNTQSISVTPAGPTTQSLSINNPGRVETRYSGSYRVESVGIAPDILSEPTAPCRIAVGVGGGWIGGALSLGGSVEDEGCTRRENARVLAGLGKSEAAVKLLCNDPEVAKVLPECGVPTTQPAGPQVSYNPSTRTTTVRELNGFNH
jgi:hypothetical protein